MSDYKALKTLIDSEPANAGRSDAAVLTWLFATENYFVEIPWTEFMVWLSTTEGLDKLNGVNGVGHVNSDVRNAARLMLTIASAGQPVSLHDTRVRSALGPLVGVTFTAAEKDALFAAATKSRTRAAGVGWANVSEQEVSNARTMSW